MSSIASLTLSNVSVLPSASATYPAYLNYDFDPDVMNPFADGSTNNFTDSSYRRSPQCTSDFNSYTNAYPQVEITIWPAETFTYRTIETIASASITSVVTTSFTETNTSDVYTGAPILGCCQTGCAIFYHSVSVKYWPVSDANTSCLSSQAHSADESTTISSASIALPHPLPAPSSAPGEGENAVGITVGPDGFT